jgi:hypothetical protein
MSKARKNRGRPRSTTDQLIEQLETRFIQMPNIEGRCEYGAGTSHKSHGYLKVYSYELGHSVGVMRYRVLKKEGKPLSYGGMVLHAIGCIGRGCINPAHGRMGNGKDNAEDVVLSGRKPMFTQKRQLFWILRQKFVLGKTYEEIAEMVSLHKMYPIRGIHARTTLREISWETIYRYCTNKTAYWRLAGGVKSRADFFKKYAKRIPGGDPYK